MSKKPLTEREQRKVAASTTLQKLAPKFTQDDRMRWALDNAMHISTVNSYLMGRVGNIVIADKLIADIQNQTL